MAVRYPPAVPGEGPDAWGLVLGDEGDWLQFGPWGRVLCRLEEERGRAMVRLVELASRDRGAV